MVEKIMIINAKDYDILVKVGALASIGAEVRSRIAPSRAVIVSDDRVYALYGEKVKDNLTDAGFDMAESFIFNHGEEAKNLSTLSEMLLHFANEGLTRTDTVFALGGGVTGDMAGFASAVYLRGIRYVGIPTSLLSMVDSSVGGKTAVDLPMGKNLVGAFHMPSFVLCDPSVLSTLEDEFFADGMAEVIKTALLGSRELFEILEGDISSRMTEIISSCVKIKRDVVESDPKDNGIRQILNLGHTLGHAIEVLSDYKIHHGHAVATGLHLMAQYAVNRGDCSPDVLSRIDPMMKKYGLDPLLYKKFDTEAIAQAALHDKKIRGDAITLVLPTLIGKVELRDCRVSDLGDLVASATEQIV